MMDYAHFGVGFLPLKLFCLVFFLGVVLFVIWAAKLDKKKLYKWVVSLLIVGAVGLLVCSLVMMKYGNYKDWKGWKLDKYETMEDIVE
ncbi:MAG: hypothetical protein ABID64_03455 [Nitrospirota bacterium]